MAVSRERLAAARREREAAQARYSAADRALLAASAQPLGPKTVDTAVAEAREAAEAQAVAVRAETELLRRHAVEGGPYSWRARHAAAQARRGMP